jgi:hypothetical protein
VRSRFVKLRLEISHASARRRSLRRNQLSRACRGATASGAKLATRPILTGSAPTANTIGIVYRCTLGKYAFRSLVAMHSPSPEWADAVEKVGRILLERNNRIIGTDFLDRTCAFDPHFGSMLREDPKLFFRQHRSISDQIGGRIVAHLLVSSLYEMMLCTLRSS